MILDTFFSSDRRVENEAQCLIDSGHTVYLMCLSEKLNIEENYNGIILIKRKIGKITYKSSVGALKFPIYFNFWKKRIRNFLDNNPVDVVHVHDLPLVKPVYELKEFYGFKMVLDLHENWPALLNVSTHAKTFLGRALCNISQWKEYEKIYIENTDAIIVVVEEARTRIDSLSDKNLNICIVSNTMNTCNLSKDKPGGKLDRTKIIFTYEGGITYHRGLQYVLDAFIKLPHSLLTNVELWIIGKGSYLETLKKQASTGNLDNVVFYGWQAQEKVFELLGQSDIALIPHIKSEHTDNTIPHKLFHYIHAGIPILSSDCVPIKRIIDETKSGITYTYDDIDDLNEKILFLVENPEKRMKYSKASKYVDNKYNWRNDEKRLIELYKSL